MKQRTLRFYSLPELFDVQLVHGLNVSHHFPRHIHTSFSLGMIERGERVLKIRRESLVVKAGECFILLPYEPHLCSVNATKDLDYWTLSISARHIEQIARDIRGAQAAFPAFSQRLIRQRSLFQAMQAFVTAVANKEELLSQESQFRELMRVCFTLDTEGYKPLTQTASYAVGKVRKYLEQHFDEKIRLEELAKLARISPFYLTRIFERELGVPPYEYLVKIRLAYAQRFLTEGESIAGAAYRTGFADQSHFNRFFKRHVGLTPGEFVRTSRARM